MFDPSSFWPATPNPPAREKRTPIGIKFLCIIGGLSTLLITYSLLATLGDGLWDVVVAGFVVTVAVVQLLGFYGLWILQFWGWAIVLSSYVLAVVIAVVFVDVRGILAGAIFAYYVYSKHEFYV